MARKYKKPYNLLLNYNCTDCVLRHNWNIFMRCEEHRKHYREHWYKQINNN